MVLNIFKKIGLFIVSLIIAQVLMYFIFDDILINITSNSIVFLLSRLVLAFIILGSFIAIFSLKKQKQIHISNRLIFLIYTLYTLCLIAITLFKGSVISSSYNLIPFKSFIGFSKVNNNISFLNIISNLLMFLPLGIILFSWKKTLFNSFQFIVYTGLGIEFVQFFFKRGVFDVDDLILYTLGGVMGFLISKSFLFKKKNRKLIGL